MREEGRGVLMFKQMVNQRLRLVRGGARRDLGQLHELDRRPELVRSDDRDVLDVAQEYRRPDLVRDDEDREFVEAAVLVLVGDDVARVRLYETESRVVAGFYRGGVAAFFQDLEPRRFRGKDGPRDRVHVAEARVVAGSLAADGRGAGPVGHLGPIACPDARVGIPRVRLELPGARRRVDCGEKAVRVDLRADVARAGAPGRLGVVDASDVVADVFLAERLAVRGAARDRRRARGT